MKTVIALALLGLFVWFAAPLAHADSPISRDLPPGLQIPDAARPGPAMSVLPSNVIGAWLSSSPAPLNDASPATVSGASRVSMLWLALHEKSPITVTSPPDSDASVR